MQQAYQRFTPTRRHWGTRRGGAVLIEAALVLMVFILLTFGMVEYGYLIFVMHTTTGAVRSGARAAIVAGSSTTAVSSAVDGIMTGSGFTTTQYSVVIEDKTSNTTNADPATVPAGHDVAVHVKATWSNIGVGVLNLVSPSRVIDSVVVMRKEG